MEFENSEDTDSDTSEDEFSDVGCRLYGGVSRYLMGFLL